MRPGMSATAREWNMKLHLFKLDSSSTLFRESHKEDDEELTCDLKIIVVFHHTDIRIASCKWIGCHRRFCV
jgi:hypothetical protein